MYIATRKASDFGAGNEVIEEVGGGLGMESCGVS